MFLMFHYLYYSVKNNESKEKFRIVLCCFSAIGIIGATSSSPNFPTKLIVFACLNKSILMTL